MERKERKETINQSTQLQKESWVQKWIQKLIQQIQLDENKKMIQVFILDPILNYLLERIFPYVLILSILFVILTIMIALTLLLVFTRLPGVLRNTAA